MSINHFQQAVNFRSLDHKFITRQKLYRSGDLTMVGDYQAKYLYSALGIRTFVDLRSNEEIKRYDKPSNLIEAGIKWVHSPIEGYPNNSISEPIPSPQAYAHYYYDILQCCSDQISKALEQIAKYANEPLVFGCYAGKDRTGLIAICLMEIGGAGIDRIRIDYAESTAELYKNERHFQGKWLKRNIDSKTYMQRITAHPETVDYLYELLKGKSVVSHLKNLGLKSSTIKKLTRLY